MQIQDLKKIKYKDYIQVQWPNSPPEKLIFGKVLSTVDPGLIYLETSIVWTQIYPVIDIDLQIRWDYYNILKYVIRVVEDPVQRKFLKLLYDKF